MEERLGVDALVANKEGTGAFLRDRAGVGETEGAGEGEREGARVGFAAVGVREGLRVGVREGRAVGTNVGEVTGLRVGLRVGCVVGPGLSGNGAGGACVYRIGVDRTDMSSLAKATVSAVDWASLRQST